MDDDKDRHACSNAKEAKRKDMYPIFDIHTE